MSGPIESASDPRFDRLVELNLINCIEAARKMVNVLVRGVHECAPDNSTHSVRVGDLRILQALLSTYDEEESPNDRR